MSIRTHIENAIRGIEAEKENAIREVKDRIIREKVAPHNSEIDKLRDEAISELSKNLNEGIVKLQTKFSEDKQNLIDTAEKNKTTYMENTTTAEVSSIGVKYDQVISKLKEQLEKIKE